MLEEDKQKVYVRWLRQAASRSTVRDASYDRAWKVEREAARLLRERYGISRVRAFGSLVHQRRFHTGSDIDLAVEGLEPADYWEARRHRNEKSFLPWNYHSFVSLFASSVYCLFRITY